MLTLLIPIANVNVKQCYKQKRQDLGSNRMKQVQGEEMSRLHTHTTVHKCVMSVDSADNFSNHLFTADRKYSQLAHGEIHR